MMTKTDIKHIDELGKASRIIKELGYEPDESMCDDRPDNTKGTVPVVILYGTGRTGR